MTVALNVPTILPDGTAILSGPVPGGQIASGMTQVVPRSTDPGVLSFSGYPGGMFTICGSDFGPVGMVFVGNQQVTVTSWQDYRIKGLLPVGLNTKQDVTVVNGLNIQTTIPYKVPPPLVSQNASAPAPQAPAPTSTPAPPTPQTPAPTSTPTPAGK